VKNSTLPLFDVSAISLSALCLIHCLALPVLVGVLPVLSAWQSAKWVHILFVAIALPLTTFALWRSHRRHALPRALMFMAAGGILGLAIGSLGWPDESFEVPVTVAGSLLLASAHLWNWSRHSRGSR
jgi:hypothetical protein